MPVQLCSAPLKYKDTNGNYQDVVGIKGENYVLTNEDKEEIAAMSAVQDVQVDGTSVLNNGVANVPLITPSAPGVIISSGALQTFSEYPGRLYIRPLEVDTIKIGSLQTFAVTPSIQHASTFYGLSKAAGDTTQSQSSNAVGNYTETAKSAISEMLNAPVSVSGTNPTITCLPGIQYICGEVYTINITPSVTGICDIIFTSGSTPTVLTIPNTIKWPVWFDPTSLVANTTYEINISNGIYGTVMAWT